MDKKISKVKSFRTKKTLYTTFAVFFLLIISFIVQGADISPFNVFPLIALLGLAFLVLGGYLIFLSRQETGKLKLLLLITGISAIAPIAGSILHNFFYALAVAFPTFTSFFEILHVTFFLTSILIAPFIFIISCIYSLIFLHRKK